MTGVIERRPIYERQSTKDLHRDRCEVLGIPKSSAGEVQTKASSPFCPSQGLSASFPYPVPKLLDIEPEARLVSSCRLAILSLRLMFSLYRLWASLFCSFLRSIWLRDSLPSVNRVDLVRGTVDPKVCSDSAKTGERARRLVFSSKFKKNDIF